MRNDGNEDQDEVIATPPPQMAGPAANAGPTRGSRALLFGGLGLLVVMIAGAWLSHRSAAASSGREGPAAVAVNVMVARRGDVPVYLEGLGTVQALYTAKVASRVDGLLQRVDFVEGQEVKRGDVLAQIDPRPLQAALDQAQATLARDAAQLDDARRNLARYVALAPQNLIPAQTVDAQRAQVAQLQAQLRIDQAVIDNARTQLDYATIRAPLAGRTGIRQVDPGNNVHATDTAGIVVVTQLQPISVIFSLPEDALPAVARAMAAGAVTIAAWSRDEKTLLDTGKLDLIDNEIDPSTGTMRLKGSFPNAHRMLWPGQFVNVRVLVEQQRDVVTLASSAIQRGPDGLFAYVVRPDSTVEARALTALDDNNGVTVVTAGLRAGEQVVTSNQYRLEPGSHVRPLSSEQNGSALAAQHAP